MNKHSFIKTIFAEYGSELKRFVANKLGNPDDAEDIVQDAFHNILRSESPEELENPRAYLYQTANNLALNRIRKQSRHDNYLTAQDENQYALPPEDSVSAHRDLEAVQNVLDKLPEKCRRAFILSRVHAKTYQEISDEVGVSVSTVEKYMIKTLRFLRENVDRKE